MMRKMTATYIRLLLAVVLLLPIMTWANPASAQVTFTDYKPGEFGYANVITLANQGIIKGYDDGSFRPNHRLNRADAAVLFQRALKLPAAQGTSFKDVRTGLYYTSAAAATKQAGIFRGNPDGTFGPTDRLTREQMASVLVRAFELKPVSTTSVKINDQRLIAQAHLQDVITLYQNGVTKGKPGDVFDPKGFVTRAEFTVFLFRAMELGTIPTQGGTTPAPGAPAPGVPGVGSSTQLTSIFTVDSNNNGRIDAVLLQFSVSIASSSVEANKFTVNGYTISSVQTSGSTITLNLTERSSADTDARPSVTYTGNLKDTSGNDVGQVNATASDMVRPMISAAHLTTSAGTQITGAVSNTATATTISFDLSAEPNNRTLRDGKMTISENVTMTVSNPLGGTETETLTKGENNMSFAALIAELNLDFGLIRELRDSFAVTGTYTDSNGNSRSITINVKMK
ncbi:S-layer homology domain-containing protein [Anaerobacillus alkaliphilus]|uniref:S-layer homology domain-containing protein n=1 Tax=Anaerobacillus alkaliphilus TaxID=1548597 RepID=A0A4Q0VVA6_9BACI|nr:S-layer homology domain-containing protein [Anaerobacillus alkaliphilus]RXJ02266.1 S-layer homology domain-containing protein [Anaerobacillus alkaliphilus]